MPEGLTARDRILVRSGNRREFVAIADIVLVTSMGGNYTQIYKTDESWIDARCTMKQWEKMLPPGQFARVHRATIVNLEQVHTVAKQFSGGYELRVRHLPDPVAVSRRSAQNLGNLLGQCLTA